MMTDKDDDKSTETVFQRNARLKAEKDGITREEAEKILLDETAARLCGDHSPKKQQEARDLEKIVRLAEAKKSNPFGDKKSLCGDRYQQPDAPPRINIEDIKSSTDCVAYFNADHFKTYLNGKFKVVRENPDGSLEIMEEKAFIAGFQEMWLSVKLAEAAENEPSKPMRMIDIWLKNRSARFYRYGFEFDCSAPGNRNGKYNLFKDWKVKPVEGDVAPWNNFVKDIISSGDEDSFNFLDALIAQMFQHPNLKPSVTTVIRGDEGVGKSFFIEHLSALAAPYFFKTSNPSYVFGDHNGQLKDVILLHLEEAVWPGGKKTESLLKDLISSPTIEINDKFVPVYSVANHLHLFITGNPDWLAHASLKARRIFALHANDVKRNNTEYFAGLDEWFKNGGAEALMYHYLNLKSDINLRIVPVTQELLIQKQQSMSPVQEWWMSILENKEMPFGEFVNGKKVDPNNEDSRVMDGGVRVIRKLLYLDYSNSAIGKRNPLSDAKFAYQFLELLPLVIDGVEQKNEQGLTKTVIRNNGVKIRDSHDVRRDGYELPNCDDSRALMEFKLGGKKVWGAESGDWTILRLNRGFDFSSYKPDR
jgi:hypothetical protein